MTCQALVRSLNGRTICLQFPGPLVEVGILKSYLSSIEGLPEASFRLVSGTCSLEDSTVLEADPLGLLPSCSILLRLRGGKGGFGSLLRGAQSSVGQRKNTNFDACRDMDGRRLRHVNAERELMEWQATAQEREEARKAAEAQRKAEKEAALEAERRAAVQKLREVTEVVHVDVADAVGAGLAEARKLQEELKRKGSPENDLGKGKRAKIWGMLDEFEEDDEEEDDDDELPAVTHEAGPSGTGPSSSGEGAEVAPRDKEDQVPSPSSDKGPAKGSPDVAPGGLQEDTMPTEDSAEEVQAGEAAAPPSSEGKEEGPIDLEQYSSAKELEALGLERLKGELLRNGLKSGGSLKERASRLFLLKTTPLEEIDAKHLVKPAIPSKKH